MKRKEPSAKLVRAQRYNRANGQFRGMITMLNDIKSELPWLDEVSRNQISKIVGALRQVRQNVIERQNELIEEGK